VPEHNHPTGHGRLVFACPACRAEVEADQARAEVDEGILRSCMITWVALGRGRTVNGVELKIPSSWTRDQAFDWYRTHLDDWLDKQVVAAHIGSPYLNALLLDAHITAFTPGPPVEDEAEGDQLSMFD
jgi:hypothetical protein